MKTVTEWDQAILTITMKIQQEFPELSKHLSEMPVSFSEKDNEEITIADLEDYYNSLDELLTDYKMTHKPSNKSLVTFPPNVNHNPFDHLPKNSSYKEIKVEKDIDPNTSKNM